MIQLESIEHDYIRSLKSQSYKQMRSLSRKESVGLKIRGLRIQSSQGVIFCHWNFLFSCSKASDWYYCQFCQVCEKLYLVCT